MAEYHLNKKRGGGVELNSSRKADVQFSEFIR